MDIKQMVSPGIKKGMKSGMKHGIYKGKDRGKEEKMCPDCGKPASKCECKGY
jgi:DTW domain-containing protein YfiP